MLIAGLHRLLASVLQGVIIDTVSLPALARKWDLLKGLAP